MFVFSLQNYNIFWIQTRLGGLFFGNSMKFAFRVQVNSIVNLAEQPKNNL